MRLQFQKRRYYKGSFRNIGDVVEVSNKFARAFLRVGAAVPAPNQPETPVVVKPVEAPQVTSVEPKFTRRKKVNRVPAPKPEGNLVVADPPSTQLELFPWTEEEMPEDLPEEEDE
jgi:hypothetical protein